MILLTTTTTTMMPRNNCPKKIGRFKQDPSQSSRYTRSTQQSIGKLLWFASSQKWWWWWWWWQQFTPWCWNDIVKRQKDWQWQINNVPSNRFMPPFRFLLVSWWWWWQQNKQRWWCRGGVCHVMMCHCQYKMVDCRSIYPSLTFCLKSKNVHFKIQKKPKKCNDLRGHPGTRGEPNFTYR